VALYSERFFGFTANNAWHTFVIPAGHRLILRSVACKNFGSGAQTLQLILNNIYILNQSVPAGGTVQLETRQVGYAGETLQGHFGTGSATIIASGYLFDDPGALLRQELVVHETEERPITGKDIELLPS
jgi:hypothetical protein